MEMNSRKGKGRIKKENKERLEDLKGRRKEKDVKEGRKKDHQYSSLCGVL